MQRENVLFCTLHFSQNVTKVTQERDRLRLFPKSEAPAERTDVKLLPCFITLLPLTGAL
jgi:hypothetical protein